MSIRQQLMLSAALLALAPSFAAAQNPPVTLWSFLGIPQGVRAVNGALVNRRGNFPGLEMRPPLRAIADPRNLLSKVPAIKTAAEIKAQEDLKKQKIKALKYLATMGCVCYPGVLEAFEAALEDCTEDVRLQAAKSIEATATKNHKEKKADRKQARKDRRQQRHNGQQGGSDCQSCQICGTCGGRGCCGEEMSKKLAEIVYEKDENGCWLEKSEKVRTAALAALKACNPDMQYGPYEPYLPEALPEPEPEKKEGETPDPTPGGSETPDPTPPAEVPNEGSSRTAESLPPPAEPALDNSATRRAAPDRLPRPEPDELVPVLEINELHFVPIHGPAEPMIPPKMANPEPIPFPTAQIPIPQPPAAPETSRIPANNQIAEMTSILLGDRARPDLGPPPTVLGVVNNWRNGKRPSAYIESPHNSGQPPADIAYAPTSTVPTLTVREVYPLPQRAPSQRQLATEELLARSEADLVRRPPPSVRSRHTVQEFAEPTITIEEPTVAASPSAPRIATRDVSDHRSAPLSGDRAATSTVDGRPSLRWRSPAIR